MKSNQSFGQTALQYPSHFGLELELGVVFWY